MAESNAERSQGPAGAPAKYPQASARPGVAERNADRERAWLPAFRRTFVYLHPHARPLITGLVLAVGVGVFYAFSISSVIPLLKIMFAEHEPVRVWLNRTAAEQRLGIATFSDLRDDPAGFEVKSLKGDRNGALSDGDLIHSLGGEAPGSYGLYDRIAHADAEAIENVTVRSAQGEQRRIPLNLGARPMWLAPAETVVGWLPGGSDARSRLWALGAVMVVLVVASLLGSACRFGNDGLVAVAVQRAMHDLRTNLGSHVLRLPVDWHARHPPGDAIARFSNDISKIEVGLTTLFGKMVREPLKAAGVLALTIWIDYRMLFIAAVGLPIGALVIRTFGRGVKRAQKRASQSWGRLLDHLSERLAGIRVVKAYGMEDREVRHFSEEDARLTQAQTRVELLDAATKPVLETLAMFGVALFVMFGGSLVFNNHLEAHWFFGAVVCLVGTFDPLRKLGNVNNRVQQADASAGRIFELIDLEPESAPARSAVERASVPASIGGGDAVKLARAGTEARSTVALPPLPPLPPLSPLSPLSPLPPLPPLRASIQFENISFAYPARPDVPVLIDVNLTVRKGQMVALVGPNGSGKTTLVSLLMRFFEPQRGRILIDGVDIASVSLESLRGQIGLVTQDTVIFSDTARFNIAYGANGVSEEEILRAARTAHADEFIRVLRSESGSSTAGTNGELTSASRHSPIISPNGGGRGGGYDALISGRTLSGGQRQRIAIARAILRDPPILVLDEATSQVDADSERKIQEAMEEIIEGRTTFVIAHRFSTIARADVVVVLDRGRVVGVGSHDQLIGSCACYRALYETQFSAG